METAPRNCRFLSLVVVERALSFARPTQTFIKPTRDRDPLWILVSPTEGDQIHDGLWPLGFVDLLAADMSAGPFGDDEGGGGS